MPEHPAPAPPELSLLLVARDEAQFIADALTMAANQTLDGARFEIIVAIDPGTTDATEAIARATLEAHAGLRGTIIRSPRSSLAVGWNAAIRAARAPRVIRWDVHGAYPPEFLARSLASLESHEDEGVAIVGGPCTSALPPGAHGFWSQAILAAERSPAVQASAFRGAGEPRYVPTVARGLYRRNAFERAGLFRKLSWACEDADCHARIRDTGARFWFDPQIRSTHYVRTTLRDLDRQKFRNGAAVSSLALLNAHTFRPKHLLPMALVGAFGLTVIGGLLGSSTVGWLAWAPLMSVLVTYVLALAAASRSALRRDGVPAALACMVVIARIHLAYGLGSWWGLLTFWRDLGKPIPRLAPAGGED